MLFSEKFNVGHQSGSVVYWVVNLEFNLAISQFRSKPPEYNPQLFTK